MQGSGVVGTSTQQLNITIFLINWINKPKSYLTDTRQEKKIRYKTELAILTSSVDWPLRRLLI